MAIAGFEYKEFAQNLTEQALQLVPPDFTENERQYVANTLQNFSGIAGEALSNDTESNFSAEQAVMITQIIAEWSFHKSVDLVRSGLPQQFWDPIMQKIAFTIFEVAKQAFKQNFPQEQVLSLIEHHVKKTYSEAVQELKEKDLIDEGLMEQAVNQSNIDSMMQQAATEGYSAEPADGMPLPSAGMPQQAGDGGAMAEMPPVESPKVLKLATLAMLFNRMKQEKVQTILDKFGEEDAHSVIKFMGMGNDLDRKMDPNAAMQCLQEIRTKLPGVQTKTFNTADFVARIKAVSEQTGRKKLEQKLALERKNVQKFVFKAIEGEYFELPPRVANIIVRHLAESV